MIPLIAATTALLLVSLAEWMHGRRIRVVARLAFGPRGSGLPWTRVVPWLKGASLTAFAWGVTTLLMLKLEAPDDATAKERHDTEATRLVFVADLSPSIFLQDSGPDGTLTRHARMREVVELPMLHPERFVALGIDPPKVCGVGWSGNCWGLGDRAGCISAAVQ